MSLKICMVCTYKCTICMYLPNYHSCHRNLIQSIHAPPSLDAHRLRHVTLFLCIWATRNKRQGAQKLKSPFYVELSNF